MHKYTLRLYTLSTVLYGERMCAIPLSDSVTLYECVPYHSSDCDRRYGCVPYNSSDCVGLYGCVPYNSSDCVGLYECVPHNSSDCVGLNECASYNSSDSVGLYKCVPYNCSDCVGLYEYVPYNSGHCVTGYVNTILEYIDDYIRPYSIERPITNFSVGQRWWCLLLVTVVQSILWGLNKSSNLNSMQLFMFDSDRLV